jgi:ribonuclease P protein component
MVRNTFGKEERLCSKKIIDALFSGKEVKKTSQYPLMAIWKITELPENSPAQILFSVPKKKFKKAHDRNLLKRQCRETYRLQKNILYETLSLKRLQCAVVMIYVAPEMMPYTTIENSCHAIIKNIIQSV